MRRQERWNKIIYLFSTKFNPEYKTVEHERPFDWWIIIKCPAHTELKLNTSFDCRKRTKRTNCFGMKSNGHFQSKTIVTWPARTSGLVASREATSSQINEKNIWNTLSQTQHTHTRANRTRCDMSKNENGGENAEQRESYYIWRFHGKFNFKGKQTQYNKLYLLKRNAMYLSSPTRTLVCFVVTFPRTSSYYV